MRPASGFYRAGQLHYDKNMDVAQVVPPRQTVASPSPATTIAVAQNTMIIICRQTGTRCPD
jgi:hypothetical protein